MLAVSAEWLEWEESLGRRLIVQENFTKIAKSGGQKRDIYYACIKGLRMPRQRKPLHQALSTISDHVSVYLIGSLWYL